MGAAIGAATTGLPTGMSANGSRTGAFAGMGAATAAPDPLGRIAGADATVCGGNPKASNPCGANGSVLRTAGLDGGTSCV